MREPTTFLRTLHKIFRQERLEISREYLAARVNAINGAATFLITREICLDFQCSNEALELISSTTGAASTSILLLLYFARYTNNLILMREIKNMLISCVSNFTFTFWAVNKTLILVFF